MPLVRMTQELVDAWEVWTVKVPDTAPDPVTCAWLEQNLDKCEILGIEDAGSSASIVVAVEEVS